MVFAIPGSPITQLWAVIACNTLFAFVGIPTTNLVSATLLAMPLAASLSILGDVHIALPAPVSRSGGFDCGVGVSNALPLGFFPL